MYILLINACTNHVPKHVISQRICMYLFTKEQLDYNSMYNELSSRKSNHTKTITRIFHYKYLSPSLLLSPSLSVSPGLGPRGLKASSFTLSITYRIISEF